MCLTSFLLALCGCGPQAPTQEVAKSTKARKPISTRDTGKLGKICKTVVEDARKDKDNPKPFLTRSDLKARFIEGHNDIRARYNLDPLQWDDGIARYAQAWADHLKTHNQCTMQHRSHVGREDGKKYGENLAWNWTNKPIALNQFAQNPEFAVFGWSKECKDYSFVDASCTPKKKCGHFTQMVWQSIQKFGCGMAVCDNVAHEHGVGRAEVWVCNYDPPGNVYQVDASGKKTPLKPF